MTAPLNPSGENSNVRLVTVPSTGASGPDKSAVEVATEQARQRLAASGSSLPPDPIGQPRVAPGDAAGRGGQFAPGTVKAVPEPTPESGNVRPAGDQPLAEGEQPAPIAKAGEEVPAPKPGEQPAGDESVTSDDETEHPELRVVVPALAEGEDELHLELDNPEVAARVSEIVSQVAQIGQREEAALAAYQEIDDVRDSIVADPVGFALNMVKSDPKAVEHLVLGLLTQPEVWQRLEPTIKKLATDPNEQRIVAAEQRGARAEYRDQAQQRISETRAVRENLNQLQSAVAAMIPEDVDGNRANEMFRVMLGKIQEHADRHGLITFPVESVGPLLTPTLSAFGIDPIPAVQRAAKAAMRRQLPSRRNAPFAGRPAASGTNGNGSGNGRPAPKKPNGQDFKASEDRRRAAAAPGAGAGSPGLPNDLMPPRKPDGSSMSTEETVTWHRAQLKKRGNALRSG